MERETLLLENVLAPEREPPEVKIPALEATIGRCHICQDRTAEIGYCGLCEHWFCADCRDAWFSRGLEYLKQLLGGRRPGCCGPREVN